MINAKSIFLILPVVLKLVLIAHCFLLLSCTDKEKDLFEYSTNEKTGSIFVTTANNPSKFKCVLQVPLGEPSQDDGELYDQFKANEFSYQNHLASLTGYRYFLLPQSKITSSSKPNDYKHYILIPSYFDCKMSTIIYKHIYKQYYRKRPPKISYSTQEEYVNIIEQAK